MKSNFKCNLNGQFQFDAWKWTRPKIKPLIEHSEIRLVYKSFQSYYRFIKDDFVKQNEKREKSLWKGGGKNCNVVKNESCLNDCIFPILG